MKALRQSHTIIQSFMFIYLSIIGNVEKGKSLVIEKNFQPIVIENGIPAL